MTVKIVNCLRLSSIRLCRLLAIKKREVKSNAHSTSFHLFKKFILELAEARIPRAQIYSLGAKENLSRFLTSMTEQRDIEKEWCDTVSMSSSAFPLSRPNSSLQGSKSSSSPPKLHNYFEASGDIKPEDQMSSTGSIGSTYKNSQAAS